MARPISVKDQERRSKSEILSAQLSMDESLWHPIAESQRHPITDFHNDSAMRIGDRIRAEREAQQLSRNDLSALSGVKYPTLAGIENGDQNASTKLHAIARALKVNPQWLETGRGPKEAAVAAVETDWADILGYAQSVGLGKGAEAQEYAETHKLKFRADSLARKRLRPAGLAVMYGQGDSMLPRIKPGDAILFDTHDTRPRDGAVFVVQLGREIYVKRCEILDDLVFFKSDNPQGDHAWRKPKRMDAPRHPITVLGRVRWIGSWED